jgi:ribose transport system substrate-binding protein
MRQFVVNSVLSLCIILCLLGCSREPSPATQEKAIVTIAVIPKGLVHQFWLTVKAGAEQAAQESSVKILWKGPARETDVAGQVAIVEDMISRGVDAIVMAACDARALVPTVAKAVEKKVPVITIDSGVDSDLPVTFVATDNVAGAGAAADTLAKLIGGKGKVGLIPFIPGAATSDMRERGFKEQIAKYPDIQLVQTLYSQSDAARGMAVTEDMLTSHADLAGIFATNEPGALGCVRAVESRGLAGKVKLVAFDAADAEIDALKRGTIQALIVQNPFKMGYLGVQSALKAIRGEQVEKRIDTGVSVVTHENMAEPEIQRLLYPLGQ